MLPRVGEGPSVPLKKPATGTTGCGRTDTQRADPLTLVAVDELYPETQLSSEQLEAFEDIFTREVEKPNVEASFCRGRVFIFVQANLATR